MLCNVRNSSFLLSLSVLAVDICLNFMFSNVFFPQNKTSRLTLLEKKWHNSINSNFCRVREVGQGLVIRKAVKPYGPALRNTLLELHNNRNDNMFQRKATQLAAYGLQLSLLCAPYTKLRRQVGGGGRRRGTAWICKVISSQQGATLSSNHCSC